MSVGRALCTPCCAHEAIRALRRDQEARDFFFSVLVNREFWQTLRSAVVVGECRRGTGLVMAFVVDPV